MVNRKPLVSPAVIDAISRYFAHSDIDNRRVLDALNDLGLQPTDPKYRDPSFNTPQRMFIRRHLEAADWTDPGQTALVIGTCNKLIREVVDIRNRGKAAHYPDALLGHLRNAVEADGHVISDEGTIGISGVNSEHELHIAIVRAVVQANTIRSNLTGSTTAEDESETVGPDRGHAARASVREATALLARRYLDARPGEPMSLLESLGAAAADAIPDVDHHDVPVAAQIVGANMLDAWRESTRGILEELSGGGARQPR